MTQKYVTEEEFNTAVKELNLQKAAYDSSHQYVISLELALNRQLEATTKAANERDEARARIQALEIWLDAWSMWATEVVGIRPNPQVLRTEISSEITRLSHALRQQHRELHEQINDLIKERDGLMRTVESMRNSSDNAERGEARKERDEALAQRNAANDARDEVARKLRDAEKQRDAFLKQSVEWQRWATSLVAGPGISVDLMAIISAKIARLEAELAEVERIAAHGLGFTWQRGSAAETFHYRTALHSIIDELRSKAQPATPTVPGPCSATCDGCTGAGNAPCKEVVRMSWLPFGELVLADPSAKWRSGFADDAKWWLNESTNGVPTIAGIHIREAHGNRIGRAANRCAAEAEIMRQVRAVKPWVRFAFEEGES
jgi:hypothetical protein